MTSHFLLFFFNALLLDGKRASLLWVFTLGNLTPMGSYLRDLSPHVRGFGAVGVILTHEKVALKRIITIFSPLIGIFTCCDPFLTI